MTTKDSYFTIEEMNNFFSQVANKDAKEALELKARQAIDKLANFAKLAAILDTPDTRLGVKKICLAVRDWERKKYFERLMKDVKENAPDYDKQVADAESKSNGVEYFAHKYLVDELELALNARGLGTEENASMLIDYFIDVLGLIKTRLSRFGQLEVRWVDAETNKSSRRAEIQRPKIDVTI